MSLPLIVHSKLFWYYNGRIDCCWYLGMGDGTSIARQDAYIRDMNRFGIDTITLNICNEAISSPFSGEFMNSSWNEEKVNSYLNFTRRLKDAGKIVVIVFFDCPPIQNAKYPVWKYKERIPDFLEIATTATAPFADGYLLGIETNRGPLSVEETDYGIKHIQKFAKRMVGTTLVDLPVSTHEQNVSRRNGRVNNKNKATLKLINKKIPVSMELPGKIHEQKPVGSGGLYLTRPVMPSSTFVAYETMNHPFNGCNVPIAQMVEEVTFLVANSGGRPVWVVENNEKEDAYARAQNTALANIPGVVGVGGPM